MTQNDKRCDHDFMPYAIPIGFVLFLAILLLVPDYSSITGYAIKTASTGQISFNVLLGVFALIIVLFFVYLNRGDMRSFIEHIIGSFAIFAGLYAVIKFVPNLELLIALLSLTFGIMGIFWTLRARNSLSEGSSLRAFATAFMWVLIFILFFSLWDSGMSVFNIGQQYFYMKYVIITAAYIVIVYAAYKILQLGKEFGFQTEGFRIKRAITTSKRRKKRR